jgi:hypothetical protein
MAEGIRLELSLADKFTVELKKHKDSLGGFRAAVKDTQFKFQFAWAQMEDSLKRFSVGSVGQKVKQLAAVMETAVRKMQAAWHRLAVGAMNGGARIGNALNSIRQKLTSLPALLASSAIALSFGAAIKKGIEFNATVESLTMQFEVMTRSATRARNIMKDLVSFAASTPFEMNEVASTAKSLMAFGLTGNEWLRRVGDAAAAANQPITEMAAVFGKIASGSFGEAFMRLAETGIATRKMLEGQGLKFDKGGSYVGTIDKALSAISSIVDTRFGGMMDKMSQTWQGKISTLKDNMGMVLGVATGRLFDSLKPRLDRLDKILQRIVSGGAAAALGERLSRPIIAVLDTALKWLSDPEKLFGKFFEWGDRVGLVFTTIWAGIKWVWNLMSEFVEWSIAGFAKLGMTAERALSKIGLADWDKETQAKLDATSAKFDAAGQRLRAAFADEGALQHWRTGIEEINSRIYDLAQLGRSGGSSLSAILTGKSTGEGLDTAPSFARTPKIKAPGNEFLDRNASRLKAEQDLETAIFEMRLENFDITRMALDQLDAQWMETKKEMWSDYYEGLTTMGTELFVDSMSSLILEDAENMKLALDDIWQGVKESFVRMSLGMVAQWIKGRVKMAITEHAIMKGSAAAQLGASAPKVAAMTGETAAAAGLASAGYHAALAWMGPFGAGIAASLTGQMNATIAATKIANLAAMRGGGVLPGGGSGNEDNRMVAMSGGEAVLNRRAVDTYGRETVDALNRLQFQPSGGVFSPTFVVPGGGADARALMRDIEDFLVPELERLAKLRRFRMVMSS